MLPQDLYRIVAQYACELVLLEWVKADELDWLKLVTNTNAINYLEHNLEYIERWLLCGNPSALHLLEKYPVEELDWVTLSSSEFAWPLLEKYPQYVDRRRLCKNPAAIAHLDWDWVSWPLLFQNPAAIDYICICLYAW